MHCPAEGFTARASEIDGKVQRSVCVQADAGAGRLPAAQPSGWRGCGTPWSLPATDLPVTLPGDQFLRSYGGGVLRWSSMSGGSRAAPFLTLQTLGHLEKAVVLELTLKHLKALTALTEQQHQKIIALQNGKRAPRGAAAGAHRVRVAGGAMGGTPELRANAVPSRSVPQGSGP